MSTIEKTLAYFPLNISLFPGEDIPLRIFEPRYKQLINECKKRGGTFGIPFIKGMEIQRFGSEVKIRQVVAENSLGEMVIVVEGVSVFEILSFEETINNKLYGGGRIRIIEGDQLVKDLELMRILIYYTDHFDTGFLKDIKNNEIFIQDIARALNLSSEEKFKFISHNDFRSKEKFLLSQMRYMMKLREQEKLLRNDYNLN